jgi:hypothetical protein
VETKNAYEHPRPGIFYMVPNPKKEGTYTIYTEVQEHGGEDVSHLFLFDKVKRTLEARFKIDLDDVDAYTGIPRGRIVEPSDIHGDWIVAHGGDFPLEKYRDSIISEFSLREAIELGKIKWEIDPHEKMTAREQKEMETELKIKFTSTGWTYGKNPAHTS